MSKFYYVNRIATYLFLLPLCCSFSFHSIGQSVLEFQFDTNLLDSSPTANHLTNDVGAVAFGTSNMGDPSLVLDGNDRLVTNMPFNNSAFQETVLSLWVKVDMALPQRQIIIQGAFMGFAILVQANSGNLCAFFDSSSSGCLESIDPITDGQWHLVEVQNNGTNTTMAVDGVSQGSVSDPLFVGSGGANNRIYIGRSNQNVNPLVGEINQLKLYSTIAAFEADQAASVIPSAPEWALLILGLLLTSIAVVRIRKVSLT